MFGPRVIQKSGGQQYGTSPLDLTLTNVRAGSTLVLLVSEISGSRPLEINGGVDSRGNVWKEIAQQTESSNGFQAWVFLAKNVVGGTTVVRLQQVSGSSYQVQAALYEAEPSSLLAVYTYENGVGAEIHYASSSGVNTPPGCSFFVAGAHPVDRGTMVPSNGFTRTTDLGDQALDEYCMLMHYTSDAALTGFRGEWRQTAGSGGSRSAAVMVVLQSGPDSHPGGRSRLIRPWSSRSMEALDIDRSNPIVKGMRGCVIGGIPVDLVTKVNRVTLNGATVFASDGQWGLGWAVSGGADIRWYTPLNLAAGEFTLRIVHRPAWWPGAYTAVFDKGSSSQERELSLFVGSGGDASYAGVGLYGSGGVGAPWTAALGMTAGKTWDLCVRRVGAVVSGVVNGVLNATTVSLNTTSTAGAYLSLGANPTNGGQNYDGAYFLMQYWDRALSAREMFELYHPSTRWNFLAPAVNRSSVIVPTVYAPGERLAVKPAPINARRGWTERPNGLVTPDQSWPLLRGATLYDHQLPGSKMVRSGATTWPHVAIGSLGVGMHCRSDAGDDTYWSDATATHGNTITLALWVQFIRNPNTPYLVFSKRAAWDSTDGFGLWCGYNGSDWVFSVNGTRAGMVSGTSVEGNTYHLVGTYDQQNVKLYINGVLNGSSALTAAIGTNASVLRFGALKNSEILVYAAQFWANRALTATEVGMLYSAQRWPYTPPPRRVMSAPVAYPGALLRGR